MEMLDKEHSELSLRRQCQLIGVSRSSAYYKPSPLKAEDLEIMRVIDDQYLKIPTYGSRSMRNHLRRLGYKINRKRVQRLMRRMGISAIYPRPRTSKPHPDHKIYPYLLKGLDINEPNMVWAADISVLQQRRV